MRYYFQKTLFSESFDEAIEKVTEELKNEGFGILTEIDVQATLKNKLDVVFRKYKILGACNPTFAHKALEAELHIGTMLPCNVVVMEKDDGKINVSAIDPKASMMAVGNKELNTVAKQVQEKLKKVIESL
ncbi:MAG: DUF302 domain-containing protein [Bacteroidales bacterium]|jgi:uncharacterized protein (DUF302 family)|nr:DUF302 domain-containing protein [Bacteroidota bacterium]MEE4260317.1 DUF302 domain-containing protein [Bacteroidales bacterium]